MSQVNKIALIKEMLTSAEASLRSAQQMLSDLAGSPLPNRGVYAEMAAQGYSTTSNGKVVEGIFNGEKMIDSEGTEYPVPANYASKSKLVEGDGLKLTITDDGRFLYKQIGPVPRKTVIGPLTYEDGKYKVIAHGKTYRVLLASVTFYRAEVGDNVTIIVPEAHDSIWGAIDNVLPKTFSEDDLDDLGTDETTDESADLNISAEEEKPKRTRKKKTEEE